MNKIHNPCIQSLRAFHWKYRARIFPTQQCCLRWKEKQSTRHDGKQYFHLLSSHNGDNLRSIANLNDNARNNRALCQSQCLHGNLSRASFITTTGTLRKHEKSQERGKEHGRDKHTDEINENQDENTTNEHFKENVKRVNKKDSHFADEPFKQTNQQQTDPFQKSSNNSRNKASSLTDNLNNLVNNKNKANVFASAHDEFQEILKKKSTGSDATDKTSGIPNAQLDKRFRDDKVLSSDKWNIKMEDESDGTNSELIGNIGGKMQVGLQFETEMAFSYDDVVSFGKLSRDWNPIHYYPDDGRVKHLARVFRVRSLEEIEGKISPPSEDDLSPPANSTPESSRLADTETKAEQPKAVKGPELTPPPASNSEEPPPDEEDPLPPHKPILPGALLNNLISGIMGTQLPGPGTLVLHQTLNYKNMAFVDEKIRLRVRVTAVRKMLVTATYKAWTTRREERVVILTGDAKLVYRRT